LAATLDFTSFFTMAFLGAAHFFYSWAVFGLDIDTSASSPAWPIHFLPVTVSHTMS